MPPYDYKIAKDILTDSEKNRIIAIFLSMDNPNSMVNWALATKGFGAASEGSMRVMVGASMRKIKSAGGELAADGTNVPATPTTKKGGRKRKSDDEDESGPGKKAKPRGKKGGPKTEPKIEVTDEDDADAAADEGYDMNADNITVKTEALSRSV